MCSWPGNTTNCSLYSTVAILSLAMLQREVVLALILTEIYNFCFVCILMQLITMWKTICSLAFVNGIWNKETADGVLGHWMHNKFDPESLCVIFSSRWLLNSTAKLSRNHACVQALTAHSSTLDRFKGQAPNHLLKGSKRQDFDLRLFFFSLSLPLLQKEALKIGWLILLQVIEDNRFYDSVLPVQIFSKRETEFWTSSSTRL